MQNFSFLLKKTPFLASIQSTVANPIFISETKCSVGRGCLGMPPWAVADLVGQLHNPCLQLLKARRGLTAAAVASGEGAGGGGGSALSNPTGIHCGMRAKKKRQQQQRYKRRLHIIVLPALT